MSEQINKVLADRPQNFTTAEQLQARTNIGAQASGDYVSSTTFTAYSASIATSKLDASASSMFQPSGNYQTAGDYAYNSAVSSKQDSSAMSSYVPFSSIGADTGSAITSINGSSVGNFTGCSANNNITGNGLPGSPLGLSSEVWFTSYGASARLRYDQLGMYTDTGNTYTEIDRGALHVLQRRRVLASVQGRLREPARSRLGFHRPLERLFCRELERVGQQSVYGIRRQPSDRRLAVQRRRGQLGLP